MKKHIVIIRQKILIIYAYKESLPENQHFIEINAKETLAQIFTDIRYKKTDNEYMSESLMRTLERQGF